MSDTLHICFVSDTIHAYFDDDIGVGTGGAERQQHMLAHALRDRGHPISIATLNTGHQSMESVNGITLWRSIPDRRGLQWAPYKTLKTISALRQIDADHYYVRGNDFLCVVTAIHAAISDASFVFAVANDANVEPKLLANKGFLKKPFIAAMRSADVVVAQTIVQQSTLANEHGIRAVHIPNGYAIPDSSEIIDHDERTHVLWVGSMDPTQKKPSRFLELASQMPEIKFTMVGPPDNDQPQYYQEVEERASAIRNLDFLGYIEPDEIHHYYRDAIALVNTSDYEGFPNVFLEAWRYATPVISLHHSHDGLLESEGIGVHAGSMERLATSVEALVNDPDLRHDLGTAGREYMSEHYSLDRLVEEYDSLFRSLVYD